MAGTVRRPGKSPAHLLILTLLWILLIPLILAVLLAGGAFAYLNLYGFSYDSEADISGYLMEPAAPASTYLVGVDTDAGTFDLSLGKNDLYWVIDREKLLTPVLRAAEDTLAPYDAVLSRYGFTIESDVLYATAELYWKGFLTVPLRAELVPGLTADGKLAFFVRQVHLGTRVIIPLDNLGLDPDVPVYTLEETLHPAMRDLRAARLAGSRLVLSFGIDETRLLLELRAMDENAAERSAYLEDAAARVFLQGTEGDAYAAERTLWRQTPQALVDFKVSELAMGDADAADAYFASADPAYCERFLPELGRSAVSDLRASYTRRYTERKAALESLMTRVHEAYAGKLITLGPDTLLYAGQPLAVGSLLGADYGSFEGWFDESSVRFLWLDTLNADPATAVPAKADDLPRLGELPRTDDDVLKGFNKRKVYPLGLIFSLPNGSYRWMYRSADGRTVLLPLEKDAYDAYAESTAIPHWTAA